MSLVCEEDDEKESFWNDSLKQHLLDVVEKLIKQWSPNKKSDDTHAITLLLPSFAKLENKFPCIPNLVKLVTGKLYLNYNKKFCTMQNSARVLNAFANLDCVGTSEGDVEYVQYIELLFDGVRTQEEGGTQERSDSKKSVDVATILHALYTLRDKLKLHKNNKFLDFVKWIF